VGIYQLTSAPREGEPSVSSGKFTTVLKWQDDGTWRFHVDGYSGTTEDAFEALPVFRPRSE
jgi:hypothetical protein